VRPAARKAPTRVEQVPRGAIVDDKGGLRLGMTTVRYKGFKILVRPYQLYESTRWTVELEIRRNRRVLPFPVDAQFRTEEEADARCADLGRQIIDGKVPERSVDRLGGETRGSSALIRRPTTNRSRPGSAGRRWWSGWLSSWAALISGVRSAAPLRQERIT
jgi:hypothetical protein